MFSQELPVHVVDMIKSAFSVEFATLTKDGTPIDTPTLSFPAPDLSTIDVATGLAYPAKAERLRRNPKAGIWIDGVLPGEPTISIAGFGATRDLNIQENTDRYIKEITSYGVGLMAPWELERKAVWYWARILMCIAPKEILWWDEPEDLNLEPNRWVASDNCSWPVSDIAPSGSLSPAPKWPQPSWVQLADDAMNRNDIGHLCLVDENGFPRPIKAITIERIPDGFVLDIPKYAPGLRIGSASLSFRGKENFIGTVTEKSGKLFLTVERALPILPFVNNPDEQWTPQADTKKAIMERLEAELARRSQSIPTIPDMKPDPTPFAKLRAKRFETMMESMSIPPSD